LGQVPDGVPVIVVDNGSHDDTETVARNAGARVVKEPRIGYGAAVDTGVRGATAEIVAVMDGDGTLDPAALPRLIDAVASGSCDLAVGTRVSVGGAAMPWHARLGNSLISAWLRHQGIDVHDVSPMRVCRRADLVSLAVSDRRFGYPVEMYVKAARAGWRVREYPVSYSARAAGTRSKVSGSLLGSARAAVDVVRAMS
jgi:glycosyltransferase involved in cell wall biosynthesis